MIIGSTAIKHWFPDFPREPKDLDYLVDDSSIYKNTREVEYLENKVLSHLNQEYLEPNLLLTLKMSHLFWDLNWEKHLFDTQFLLKKGCDYDLKLLEELRYYWEVELPKVRRSALAQDKDSFFNNNVNEDIEQHDKFHYILEDVPAFTKILKDGAEVELDEEKWNKLSFQEKCDVVFEEAAVMAFERYPKLDYRVSHKKQLKENIIKHYPQYIAIFAIENYIKLEKPKYNFKIKLENGLQKN